MREEGSGLGQATGIHCGDEIVDGFREQHHRWAAEIACPGAGSAVEERPVWTKSRMRWIWTAASGWAACLDPEESSQTEVAESQLGRPGYPV